MSSLVDHNATCWKVSRPDYFVPFLRKDCLPRVTRDPLRLNGWNLLILRQDQIQEAQSLMARCSASAWSIGTLRILRISRHAFPTVHSRHHYIQDQQSDVLLFVKYIPWLPHRHRLPRTSKFFCKKVFTSFLILLSSSTTRIFNASIFDSSRFFTFLICNISQVCDVCEHNFIFSNNFLPKSETPFRRIPLSFSP